MHADFWLLAWQPLRHSRIGRPTARKSVKFERLLRGRKAYRHHDHAMTMLPPLALRRPPALLAKASFLALIVLLQCADVVTTNRALTHPGVWEGNPLMAWCMGCLGDAWWAPLKLTFVAYMLATLPFIRRTWPLALVSGFFVVLVVNNLTYW
jgi:hypothetical protein